MKKPKQHILDMSEKIRSGLVVDVNNGNITETDQVIEESKSNFNKYLPDSITPEIVQKIDDYKTDYVAAATHAIGVLAIDAFTENNKLDFCMAESIPIATNDILSVTVNRKTDYVNHLQKTEEGKSPEVLTKYGEVIFKLETKAGKNAGQLKAVKDYIKEQALATLSK